MPKLNSFARFMFDYKAKEEAKGRRMDMRTVTLEAGEIWKVRKFNYFQLF